MKKKTKLFGAIFALCLSVCMLSFGVFAASTVNLSVNSTVSFSATGVYASVSGSIWRGESTSNLTQVTENVNQTLAETKNFVEGQVSNNNFIGLENGWNPAEVSFSETNKVIEYRLTFKNYSEFPIEVNVTNNSVQGTNIKVEEITSNIDSIPADNGTTSATYILRLTLENVSVSTDMNIDLSIALDKLSYFTIQNSEDLNNSFYIYVNNKHLTEYSSYNFTVIAGDRVKISSAGNDLKGIYVKNSTGDIVETIYETETHSRDCYTGVEWINFSKLDDGNYIFVEWFPHYDGEHWSPQVGTLGTYFVN